MVPIIRIINMHLLPVHDKPMIYYPLQTLLNAGIEDIVIVTGGRNAGDSLLLLGNDREFGINHPGVSLPLKRSLPRPPSSHAVTGIYVFDGTVFHRISQLDRSARGRQEVADVNDSYITDSTLQWDELAGWWADAGTVDGLLRASQLVAETEANHL